MAELLRPFAGSRSENVVSKLLQRFGSLNRAMFATSDQIQTACGKDADVGQMLVASRRLVEFAIGETVRRSPVSAADPAFQSYLILKFQNHRYEELHAIFLGTGSTFLSDELVASGEAGSVETRIRTLLARALELDAKAILLVHNHPSDCPRPSEEDIEATYAIRKVANALDLVVADHLIVAGNQVTSFRELGLL